MAFYGCDFIFDGTPASHYGMMLYSFGSKGQDDEVKFAVGEPVEVRLNRRYDSLMYGLAYEDGMEFELVFGVNMDSYDERSPMDRRDVEAISTWLTGHRGWRWLSIVQPDMEEVRYRCVISGLSLITEGGEPWAFSCTVHCDSPYAYATPESFVLDLDGGDTSINIFNFGSWRDWYYPVVIWDKPSGATSLTVTSASDNDREMKLTGVPTEAATITIDCKNQVVTSSTGYNLYPKFNNKFLRLLRGNNEVEASGDGTLTILCQWPMQVGG